MGQLRSAIQDLHKTLSTNPKRLDAVQKALKPGNLRIEELGRTADEGWNLIFMHLTNKFKNSGGTSANAKKTLKEVLDPELIKLVKGVDDWRKNMLGVSKKYTQIFEQSIAAIAKDLAAAEADAKKLRGIANKKAKKWFKNSKYKDKIKGYLNLITDLDNTIQTQQEQVKGAQGLQFDDAWVNKWFSVNASMTVKDFENRASMDTNAFIKKYLANQEEADKYVRKLRDEYKGMAGQLKAMAQWSQVADEMEEDEDKEEDSGDGSGKIKNIKVYLGTKVIGTSDKGDFKPKTPLKLVVVWDKKAKIDPLSLLKKKVTIKAEFVDKKRGDFMNDFKVDKVLGDMKTITFA